MKKGLLCLILLLAPVFALAASDLAAKKLGDVSDGSLAVPPHRIPLLTEAESEENTEQIYPDDEPLLPFSTRRTCGDCHSYDIIEAGWHFNATDANADSGRAGEPWILADSRAATQIPLSYRPWPGTFRPNQLGITPAGFVRLFGRHLPGGGVGEMLDKSDSPDEVLRAYVTGPLEINCLACHNAHYGYDQAEFALQIARQNYRWAATSACEFASVSGSTARLDTSFDFRMPEMLTDPDASPPTVTYREGTLDHKNWVLFDIVRQVPDGRCYFCHSTFDPAGEHAEKWTFDEDIHIEAGLTCVDCHRNGLQHNITRGYEDEQAQSENPLAAASTCEGCHLGQHTDAPLAGRFAAPVPEHPGIPPVHFEKLTCTACHSGPWPGDSAIRTKTSRAHALGVLSSNKSPDCLPHLLYPVFAKDNTGKIAPHKLLWPAFWAEISEDALAPIDLAIVESVTTGLLKRGPYGDWPQLPEEQLTQCLMLLKSKISPDTQPGFVTAGKVYSLDDQDNLISKERSDAKPYLWPVAHNVRPAAQSLGVRRCEDCHSTDSPFFFGSVPVDSPLASADGASVEMLTFQKLPRFYTKAFAFSFVFRLWLKVVALLSCLVIAGVLLLYALRALGFVAAVLVGKK